MPHPAPPHRIRELRIVTLAAWTVTQPVMSRPSTTAPAVLIVSPPDAVSVVPAGTPGLVTQLSCGPVGVGLGDGLGVGLGDGVVGVGLGVVGVGEGVVGVGDGLGL